MGQLNKNMVAAKTKGRLAMDNSINMSMNTGIWIKLLSPSFILSQTDLMATTHIKLIVS